MKFSIVHDYDVPAETLWKNLFDPELEAAVKAATNLEEYTVKTEHHGDVMTRSIRVIPRVQIPGLLRKLVGEKLGYREENRVSKSGMGYDWHAVPDTLADKMTMGGTLEIEPLGPSRCRRTIAGEVNVKIFGVGKVAEKFVIDELDKGYADVARAQEKWLKEHGK